MTVEAAAELSGLTPWTIREKAKEGTHFQATKPSNKEGWDIVDSSFRNWLDRRRSKGANKAMSGHLKHATRAPRAAR